MSRIPTTIAGLVLVAASAAACGSDDGSDASASDTTPGSPSTSASASESPSDSPSSSPSGTPGATPSDTPSGDPVASPVIDKAVKDAIRADFPALIPSGVPAGWTVVSASYHAAGGGVWQIELTDPDGQPVSLRQSTATITVQLAQLPNAQPAGTVDLSDFGTGTWKAYGADGVAILAKKLSGTSAVVVAVDQASAVAFAQQLLTAEDAGNSDGG